MKRYQVNIIGGGVTGTALLYMLSNYTDIESVALLEKYPSIAPLNSNSKSNSQSLHFGDIEIKLLKARQHVDKELGLDKTG